MLDYKYFEVKLIVDLVFCVMIIKHLLVYMIRIHCHCSHLLRIFVQKL